MKNQTECAIWGTDANYQHLSDSKNWLYDSSRTGGKYIISSKVQHYLLEINDETKTRLTDWLINQRRLGVEYPKITMKQIEQAKITRPTSMIDRANSLLVYLAVQLKSQDTLITWPIWPNEEIYRMLANCSSKLTSPQSGQHELFSYFKFLFDRNWISDWHKNLSFDFKITVDGYIHLETLQSKQIESKQAFVAMWFNPTIQDAWEMGIAPAISDSGYEAMRIDRKEHNNRIDDEIIAEIRRSRFLVADFSQGEDGARGGVYYEAGFAHGLGIPVIFTCRQDDLNQVHFDTRQFNHIVWETAKDLKGKLVNRIAATIGDGPLKNQTSLMADV